MSTLSASGVLPVVRSQAYGRAQQRTLPPPHAKVIVEARRLCDGCHHYAAISRRIRCTVPLPRPSLLAVAIMPVPLARSARTRRSISGLILGRPRLVRTAPALLTNF